MQLREMGWTEKNVMNYEGVRWEREQFSGLRQNRMNECLGERKKQRWTGPTGTYLKILIYSIKPPLYALTASYNSHS